MAEQILLKPKGIKQHLENFWYHYKLHTIVLGFILIFITVGFVQCSLKEKPDIKIIVCMNKNVGDDVVYAIKTELTKYAVDLNGDGETVVDVIDTSFSPSTKDSDLSKSQVSKLMGELQLGESMIFITDEVKFEMLDGRDVFDTTDYFPDKDGKAKSLKETRFADNINKKLEGTLYENFFSGDVYISKRIVSGTSFESKESLVKNEKDAIDMISKLLKDIG